MPYTNFIGSGVSVNGAPLVPGGGTVPLSGNYFFVNSVSGSNGNLGTYDNPFATLAFALTQCTAAIGDCVILEAGHAETISAAGGIAVNKSGVSIIGLGNGANRPTFTFATSTAATMTITAANVTISNIVATTSIDQIVSPFVISAAGVTFGTVAGPVLWTESADNLEAVRCVLTTAAADNLTINLKYQGRTGGSHCVNGVRLVGVDNCVINAEFYGKASTAWVEFLTTACTDVEVYGYMYNSGTTNGSKNVVDTATGSTWYANLMDGAAGTVFDGGSGAALGPNAISSYALPRLAIKTIASASATLTTGASPVTLFTVTGDVVARVWATVQTGITSTLNNGTLAIGVTGNTGSFIAATTMDGTNFPTGSVWAGDTSPTVKSEVFSGTALNSAPIAGGTAIIATVATNSATAGAITFYCQYFPCSTNGAVVGA